MSGLNEIPASTADEVCRQLSVVIPVLNDAPALERLLGQLTGEGVEVIVVDGGSADDSLAVAERFAASVVRSSAGRGLQLQAGLNQASGDRAVMLHADSSLAPGALTRVRQAPPGWGRLRLQFDSQVASMRVVAWFMHWRSRITGICTGDQGMWVDADLLERVGGVPPQRLMEDIELSKRLRRTGRPIVVEARITTSARRWQQEGVLTTILKMWWFRLRYFFGVSSDRLAQEYYKS